MREFNEANAAEAIKRLTQTVEQLRNKVAYDKLKIAELEAELKGVYEQNHLLTNSINELEGK